uniref:Uncharacterized protein n=1 Tax=Felis catus TaxID=9685 RepID=A0ABI7VVP2_FELCA
RRRACRFPLPLVRYRSALRIARWRQGCSLARGEKREAATRAFNFERPCYLRGGICLKQGTPDCEPFRGPCRAFTVCCKVKGLWGRAAAEKP